MLNRRPRRPLRLPADQQRPSAHPLHSRRCRTISNWPQLYKNIPYDGKAICR
jgi:hypothetical protein